MKVIFLTLCILAVINAQVFDLGHDCGRGTPLNRIVGGTIAKKGDWGWQVAVYEKGSQICGGSLVNDQWVISAAHCFEDNANPKRFTIDVGNHYLNVNENDWAITGIKVSKLVMHPKYNSRTIQNDIAILKLEKPVKLDEEKYTIYPACIPDGSEAYEERNAWITGYGSIASGKYPKDEYLRQAEVMTLTNKRCKQRFNTDNTTQICAGEEKGKTDTCQGDSGGPLNILGNDGRWHFVGITSYGPDPCGEGSVYTRVSGFKDWIKQIIELY